jgi:molecular chaperone DnaK (HSP70)
MNSAAESPVMMALTVCSSYLDPTQIEKAERLAQFSKRLGKLPPNRQISDAVSRYLSALREVALDRMKADWGEDFQTSTPIEYILTVPAVWSDKAKSDTLYCASQAGFGSVGKIRLITEPEAAAIYTLHQVGDVPRPKFI